MQIQQIGDRFDDPRYYATEAAKIRLLSTGFELIACVNGLTKKEINSWKGSATVALFSAHSVPFWIFKTDEFSFDAPFNFLKVSESEREKWLQNEFNLVQFTLIEQTTGRIVAMRAIGIDHAIISDFKSILIEQTKEAESKQQIDSAIQFIINRFTTDQMLSSHLCKRQDFHV